MSKKDLLLVERTRGVVPGVSLPDPPPTRVYIDGRMYRLAPDTRVALPPIINVAKLILNWAGPGGRLAKNILHTKHSAGVVLSDPAVLLDLATKVFNALVAANVKAQVDNTWTLQSVTAKDLGGTTAQATSTGAGMVGGSGTGGFAPNTAACVSWQIASVYRGGKPRSYIPGVPLSAVSPVGSSTLSGTYATAMESNWTAAMNGINALTTSDGHTTTLGTVSYYTGHSVRPTPQFATYINVKIHERLDSQRRRNGPEAAFPVVP